MVLFIVGFGLDIISASWSQPNFTVLYLGFRWALALWRPNGVQILKEKDCMSASEVAFLVRLKNYEILFSIWRSIYEKLFLNKFSALVKLKP